MKTGPKEHVTDGEVRRMTGRNSKPDNDGPMAKPSRLDQVGDKLSDNSARIPKKRSRGNNPC